MPFPKILSFTLNIRIHVVLNNVFVLRWALWSISCNTHFQSGRRCLTTEIQRRPVCSICHMYSSQSQYFCPHYLLQKVSLSQSMNPVKVILASCSQQEVIRSLVKRYVAAMIRSAKTDEGLTEENFKVGAFSLGPVCCHSSELTLIKGRKSSSGFKEKLCSQTWKQAQMVDICLDLSIITSI